MSGKYLRKKGLAFVVVLVFILILATAAASFIFVRTTEMRMVRLQTSSTKAFYLAEAGIEKAIYELLASDGSYTGEGGVVLGDGVYDVVVFTPDPVKFPDRRRVTSTGHVPANNPALPEYQTRRIEAMVEFVRDLFFSDAVFAELHAALSSNAYTDSYDSYDGPYDPLDHGVEGAVRSNGISPETIVLQSFAKINGEAVIGPGGDTEEAICLWPGAEITGAKSAADSEKELPEITPPDIPVYGFFYVRPGGQRSISGSGKYEWIFLSNDSTLIIDPPVGSEEVEIYLEKRPGVPFQISGLLHLGNNAKLIVDEDATVTIYMDGRLRISQDAKVNCEQVGSGTMVDPSKGDPTKLSIYGTDSQGSIHFRSDSVYYGTVYARKANVLLYNNATFYGAIVAERVFLRQNAAVHYDEAVGRGGGPTEDSGEETQGISLLSWREI